MPGKPAGVGGQGGARPTSRAHHHRRAAGSSSPLALWPTLEGAGGVGRLRLWVLRRAQRALMPRISRAWAGVAMGPAGTHGRCGPCAAPAGRCWWPARPCGSNVVLRSRRAWPPNHRQRGQGQLRCADAGHRPIGTGRQLLTHRVHQCLGRARHRRQARQHQVEEMGGPSSRPLLWRLERRGRHAAVEDFRAPARAWRIR